MRLLTVSIVTIAGCLLSYASASHAHLSIISQGLDSGETLEFNDRHGHSVAAGDFDGDGIDDLAIGAPNENLGGLPNAGFVVIVKGTHFGLDTAFGDSWDEDAASGGSGNQAESEFGYALVAADFTGDGIDDLAIGAPGATLQVGADAGAVYILRGSTDGLQRVTDLSQADAGSNVQAGDRFGASLTAGNFDGDSQPFMDLAVGSPGENGSAGAVFYFLSNVLGPVGPSGFFNQASFGETEAAGDQFGFSLAAGNLFFGAEDELVVSAPFRNALGTPGAGVVYQLQGHSTGLAVGGYSILNAGHFDVRANDGKFGYSMAIGNLMDTGGTYECLAVGEPWRDISTITQFQKAGRVLVFRGNAVGTTAVGGRIVTQGDAGGGVGAWDLFGSAVAVGRFVDVNDGWDDLVVGSPGDGLGFTSNAGQVNVFPGSATGPGTNGWWGFNQATLNDPINANDALGYSVTLGNFDGTGQGHVAVGAPGNALDAGMVHIIAPWRQTYGLSCRHAVTYDCDGNLIFSVKPYNEVLIASTTKILTVLIACERLQAGLIDPSDTYIIPSWIPANITGSLVPYSVGERITFWDAMNLCLHLSGNDAAHALADWMGGGGGPYLGLSLFIDEMNQRAAELNMTRSHFNNPNGYEEEHVGPDKGDHYSTPIDMARLSQAAMANPLFFSVSNQTTYSAIREFPDPNNPGQFIQVPWTINTFFNSIINSMIQPAVGIKGGFTNPAQTTGCYAAVNATGDVWVSGSYFTPQNHPNFNLDAANLLLLGAASEACAVEVTIPGTPPGYIPTWTSVPSGSGSISGGGTQVGWGGSDDAAVEIVPWTGTGSNDACVEIGRASSATIQAGTEIEYGVSPFHGHPDIPIVNGGTGDAELEIQTSLGLELSLSIAPGETGIIPAELVAAPFASFSMLIQNNSASGEDAEIGVRELYSFDLQFPVGSPGFTAVVKRGQSSEIDTVHFLVKGKSGDANSTLYMNVHDASSGTTPIDEPVIQLPGNAKLALRPSYPNPFSARTQIQFDLAVDGRVGIEVFDARGRRVREYPTTSLPAGLHVVLWDGRDSSGGAVAQGTYFYRIRLDGQPAASGKMTLVR